MATIISRNNVNGALSSGLRLLARDGEEELSRAGKVLTMSQPVLTETLHPMQRVLFSPVRNANPFFHLFEALWMLAGRNDLPWLGQFNKRMAEYSDDGGKTQPAAYGYRWRKHFRYGDQLDFVVNELTKNPNSRRAVVAMWDAHGREEQIDEFDYDKPPVSIWKYPSDPDLVEANGKDVPCNTHIYFRVRNGALDMTVCCRSNDAWWGAHGANAVHFSVLMEYVAARINVPVGVMYQFSNDYHVYTDVVPDLEYAAADARKSDLYANTEVSATQIFRPSTMQAFATELHVFMDHASENNKEARWASGLDQPILRHDFLRGTAMPMLRAWDKYKAGYKDFAVQEAHRIVGSDWRRACTDWLNRSRKKGTK